MIQSAISFCVGALACPKPFRLPRPSSIAFQYQFFSSSSSVARVRVGETGADYNIHLLHDVELHLGNAASHDAELLGGGLRQVDHATRDEWAAVVDPDRDGAAAPHIGDADLGAERQRPVGGGHCARVEPLTVRSLLVAAIEARQSLA